MKLTFIWLLVLLAAYGLFEWLNSIPYEKKWGSAYSPQGRWELQIAQRPRQLKQAPDIVLYQKDSLQNRQKIELLRFNEDDRSDLRYNVDWMDENNALLTLSCTNCTQLGTLYWKLKFDHTKPQLTPLSPDSIFNNEYFNIEY